MQSNPDSIFWIEVGKIYPNPYQPRREFDESKLTDLAESIRQYGVLQPLVVTRHEVEKEDGMEVTYELIAGERRLRASQMAKVAQVPALIRNVEENDQVKLELAIIENLQREDLNPIDRARAFQRLAEEFNFRHSQIAKKIGKSREYISNCVRILSLPEEIQVALTDGRLSEGHARPLMMLADKPEEQLTVFKEAVAKKMTVRDTERIARRIAHDRIRKKEDANPQLAKVEESLTEKLGTRVHIQQQEQGGKITIDFGSEEDLQHLLNAFNVVQMTGEMNTENDGAPAAPHSDPEAEEMTPAPGRETPSAAPDPAQHPQQPEAAAGPAYQPSPHETHHSEAPIAEHKQETSHPFGRQDGPPTAEGPTPTPSSPFANEADPHHTPQAEHNRDISARVPYHTEAPKEEDSHAHAAPDAAPSASPYHDEYHQYVERTSEYQATPYTSHTSAGDQGPDTRSSPQEHDAQASHISPDAPHEMHHGYGVQRGMSDANENAYHTAETPAQHAEEAYLKKEGSLSSEAANDPSHEIMNEHHASEEEEGKEEMREMENEADLYNVRHFSI